MILYTECSETPADIMELRHFFERVLDGGAERSYVLYGLAGDVLRVPISQRNFVDLRSFSLRIFGVNTRGILFK